MCAIIRIGFTETKQATAIAAAQGGKQIIESDADEPRPLNEIYNGTNALTDHDIRCRKSLMDSCFRRDHVADLIVLEADDRVGDLVKPSERLPRLCTPAFTLESKWKSGKRNDKRTGFTGELRDIRGGARAGAATEPSANKNHSGVCKRLADFVSRLHRCLIAQLRVAAGAQTTGYRATELHFMWRHGTRE